MQKHRLIVHHKDGHEEYWVPNGVNLRHTLIQLGYTPYTSITKKLNCGGRGLCATCGVWIDSDSVSPRHWHDRAAAYFGYPRLSCQIVVTADITVYLISDKVIWGKRDPQKAMLWRRIKP